MKKSLIFPFVNINQWEGTTLTIHNTQDNTFKNLLVPTNTFYNDIKDNYVNQGYDDTLVDQLAIVDLLQDIITKIAAHYVKLTQNKRGQAYTQMQLAQTKAITSTSSKLMYLPVQYIKLGAAEKISQTVAVTTGSTLKSNDFFYQYLKIGDILELVLIRDQKKAESIIKKEQSALSTKELNIFIQK